MIEASKTAELNSQPTKRGRKAWLIALAVAVAVATIVLLAIPRKHEPVKVWFVRSMSYTDHKDLLFRGTNSTKGEIQLSAAVFTGAIREGFGPTGVGPRYSSTFVFVDAEKAFNLNLSAPTNRVPYYVVWEFYDNKIFSTRWGRIRMGCITFLSGHGMRALARPLAPKAEFHYIPSTEIKE